MAADQTSALQFVLRLNDRITGPMGRVVRTVTGQAQAMAAGVNRAAALMQSGFIAAMAGVLGLAAVFRGPIGVAADFEAQMSRLRAVTQATSKEMDSMAKTARRLGATTSFSASQAAEGMQFLGLAGFKTTQIIAAMPGILDLARAGTMELSQAADIGSNILGGFSLEAKEMTRVGDVLTRTLTASNTTLVQLGEAMKPLGPVAASVGAEIEQVAALVGVLGNVGMQGARAGTSLKAMFLRLSAPVGGAANRLKQLGVATADGAGNFRGMVTILEELAGAIKPLGDTQRLAALKVIFGEEPAAAAVKLVQQAGLGKIRPFIEMLEKAGGTAARVAREMDENLRGKLRILASAWESLNNTVGDFFLPMLSRLVEKITGVVRNFETWAARMPSLTRLMGFTVVAVFGLALAVGVLKISWGLATLAMLPFRAAYGILMLLVGPAKWVATTAAIVLWKAGILVATGALWLFNAALWANPITWVVVAIIAMIAAIVLAVIYWDLITATIAFAADRIIKKWDQLIGWFSRFWDDLPRNAGYAIGFVVGWFAGLPGRIADSLGDADDWLGNLWNDIAAGFGLAVEAAVNWFAGLPGRIADALLELPRIIAGIFNKIPGFDTILTFLLPKIAKGAGEFKSGFSKGMEAGGITRLPAAEPLSGEARRALSNVAYNDNSRRIQIGQLTIHLKEEVGPDFLTRALVSEGLG